MGLADGIQDPYIFGLMHAAAQSLPNSAGLADETMPMMGMSAPRQPAPFNMNRVMESFAVRQSMRQHPIPMAHQSRSGGGARGGMMGGLDPTGGYDPSTVNSEQMNQMLAPFGQQMPSHINPFLLFNDQNQDGSPTWAANHPRVARAIEGGLLGAMTPGGDTIGENISNVARTVMGIPGVYAEHQQAQLMAPIERARAMEPIADYWQRYNSPEAGLRNQLVQSEISRNNAYATKASGAEPKIYGTPVPGKDKTGRNTYFMPDQSAGELTDTGVEVGTKPSSGISGKGSDTWKRVQQENDERVNAGQPAFTATEWNRRYNTLESQDAAAKGAGGAGGRGGEGEATGHDPGKLYNDKRDELKDNLKGADKEYSDFVKGRRSSQVSQATAAHPEYMNDSQKAIAAMTADLKAKRDAAQSAHDNFLGQTKPPRPGPMTKKALATDSTPASKPKPVVKIGSDGSISISSQ